MLTSSEADDSQELLQNLVEAHRVEAQQRGGDSKFSQHREGRHAGQSGSWWLEEAATEEGTRSLLACAGRMAEVLPVWGWKPPAAAAGGSRGLSSAAERGIAQHALTDAGLAALLKAGQGVFPMPGGRTAGTYTSMDLGRLCWTSAVLLNLTAPVPLGEESFETFMKMQGRNTRRMR